MEKERLHGYITSIHINDKIEKEKIFDLCESLVNSENNFFENSKWILRKKENSDITVENKIEKGSFEVWVDLNKETETVMAEYGKWENEYYENINRINNRIIKSIKAVKGDKFEKDFIKCITEMEINGGAWSFVKEPCGHFQEESGFGLIKGVWVDQWCNGGYSGDDFAGDIYVKLKENKFLKMGYAC